MKTIRTLMAVLMLAASSLVMADNYQYLTVTQTSTETSFSVSEIQKITFDATNMVLHLSDGTTQQLPLANLTSMFFSTSPTGIAAITQTESKIQFAGGTLRATVAPGERVAIFNMKGEQVLSANESGTFDLSNLTKGVYIVKVGQETRKVINK